MIKHSVFVALVLLAVSPQADSQDQDDQTTVTNENRLLMRRTTDAQMRELAEDLRTDEVGWFDLELVHSRRTNGYHNRYVTLRNSLDPDLIRIAQSARETKVQTMGQVLVRTGDLILNTMDLVNNTTRLNNLEFLVLSRRSTIATKLSIWIATIFGTLSMLGLAVAVLTHKRRSRNSEAKHKEILSILQIQDAKLQELRERVQHIATNREEQELQADEPTNRIPPSR